MVRNCKSITHLILENISCASPFKAFHNIGNNVRDIRNIILPNSKVFNKLKRKIILRGERTFMNECNKIDDALHLENQLMIEIIDLIKSYL